MIKLLINILARILIAMGFSKDPAMKAAGRAQSLSNQGDWDGAIAAYTEALKIEPGWALAYYNRGFCYFNKKDYENAYLDLSDCIFLIPIDALAYQLRSMASYAQGKYEESFNDLAKALEINPDHHQSHNNLAWFLATCPEASLRDGKKAVEHSRKALKAKPDEPSYNGTMGAALAEAGDFPEAIRFAKKVLSMGPSAQQRLALYEQGLPYHEERCQLETVTRESD